MSSRHCSGSIESMNSMGNRGSSCRTPLMWLKAGPCCPFSSTLDDVMRKGSTPTPASVAQTLRPAIPLGGRSSWPCQMPCVCWVSRTTRVASSFALFALWTYRKLSWMLLVLMKALWHFDTESRSGTSLFVSSVVKSWRSLICYGWDWLGENL